MKRAVTQDPDTKFFLATDDAKVIDRMRHLFGQRIFTNDGNIGSRQEVDVIEDAVVDLYCLAATRRIVGCFDSSFSQVAALIGGVPLAIVSNRDQALGSGHSDLVA